MLDASACHQGVETSRFALRPIESVTDRLLIRDIAHLNSHLAGQIQSDHGCPLLTEALADGGADPRSRTRDDAGPTLEEHSTLLRFLRAAPQELGEDAHGPNRKGDRQR